MKISQNKICFFTNRYVIYSVSLSAPIITRTYVFFNCKSLFIVERECSKFYVSKLDAYFFKNILLTILVCYRLRIEPIPSPPEGFDIRRTCRIGFNLFANLLDMYSNSCGISVIFISPYSIHQPLLRENNIRM